MQEMHLDRFPRIDGTLFIPDTIGLYTTAYNSREQGFFSGSEVAVKVEVRLKC